MKNLIEISKEVFRNAILTIVSYLLTEGIINTLVVAVAGNRIDPTVIVTSTAVLTWILRGIEKRLHDTNNKFQLPV